MWVAPRAAALAVGYPLLATLRCIPRACSLR
jgi:hypothetical protein